MRRPLDRPQAELLCADLESVHVAVGVGADRIELCAAPEVGGLTPGAGLLEGAISAAAGRLDVVALVRPRVGGFALRGPGELEALVRDVRAARAAGASGIAVGVLGRDGELDEGAMRELVSASEGMPVTLHRAIDLTPDPVDTLEKAADLGVSRVLTSGPPRRRWRESRRSGPSSARRGLVWRSSRLPGSGEGTPPRSSGGRGQVDCTAPVPARRSKILASGWGRCVPWIAPRRLASSMLFARRSPGADRGWPGTGSRLAKTRASPMPVHEGSPSPLTGFLRPASNPH